MKYVLACRCGVTRLPAADRFSSSAFVRVEPGAGWTTFGFHGTIAPAIEGQASDGIHQERRPFSRRRKRLFALTSATAFRFPSGGTAASFGFNPKTSWCLARKKLQQAERDPAAAPVPGRRLPGRW
jgi:hypothetical protein